VEVLYFVGHDVDKVDGYYKGQHKLKQSILKEALLTIEVPFVL
jgi:hypothetical protein